MQSLVTSHPPSPPPPPLLPYLQPNTTPVITGGDYSVWHREQTDITLAEENLFLLIKKKSLQRATLLAEHVCAHVISTMTAGDEIDEHTSMHAHTHASTFTYTHTQGSIFTHTHMCTHTHTRKHMCKHSHTLKHIHMYKYMAL